MMPSELQRSRQRAFGIRQTKFHAQFGMALRCAQCQDGNDGYLFGNSTHEDTTLWEIIDGDREWVADMQCPFIQGPALRTEYRGRNDVDHEVAEEVKAIDGCLAGDTIKVLGRGRRSEQVR